MSDVPFTQGIRWSESGESDARFTEGIHWYGTVGYNATPQSGGSAIC